MTKLTTLPKPSNDFMRAATTMPSALTDIPNTASSGSDASAPRDAEARADQRRQRQHQARLDRARWRCPPPAWRRRWRRAGSGATSSSLRKPNSRSQTIEIAANMLENSTVIAAIPGTRNDTKSAPAPGQLHRRAQAEAERHQPEERPHQAGDQAAAIAQELHHVAPPERVDDLDHRQPRLRRDGAQARELALGALLPDLAPGQRQEHVVQRRPADADPAERRAIGRQQLDDEGVPLLDQERQPAVGGVLVMPYFSDSSARQRRPDRRCAR